MAGSLFLSPWHVWLARTAALALALTTQQSCPSGSWSNQQLIAEIKNSFCLGWLHTVTHCASKHQSEGSGELDLTAFDALSCTLKPPLQYDLEAELVYSKTCSASQQADTDALNDENEWNDAMNCPACGSTHLCSKVQRRAPDISPAWNKKPGQGHSSNTNKLQVGVHERTVFL